MKDTFKSWTVNEYFIVYMYAVKVELRNVEMLRLTD
jgi:hypothetical protein